MKDKRQDSSDDYFSFQADKFKPKMSYPESKMKVYTKPEPKASDVEVEELDTSDSSDTAIQRIIKIFRRQD